MGVSDWFRRVFGRSREWRWSLDEPSSLVRTAPRVVYPSETAPGDEAGSANEAAPAHEASAAVDIAGKVMLWFEDGVPVALDDADPQVAQFQWVAERMMKPSLRYRLLGGRR